MKINGVYSKTLWRDDRDGTTFFTLRVPETVKERKRNEIVVFAKIPRFIKSTPLLVEGEWESTKKGDRFNASLVKEEAYEEFPVKCFLTSPICGMSMLQAEKLLRKIPYTEVFQMHNDPDAPDKICKAVNDMNFTSACMLIETIKGMVCERELFNFLVPYGGFYGTILKLRKDYGTAAERMMRTCPYIGMRYDLTFEQCDRIAADNGVYAASKARIQAAVKTVLQRISSQGDTFALQQRVCDGAIKLMSKASFPTEVSASVITSVMAEDKTLLLEDELFNKVYLKRLYYAEINVARQINRLQVNSRELNFDNSLVTYAEELCGMSYARQQKEAFTLLKRSGVAIVTGGPGTGKTTTVNGIISAYEKMYPDHTIKLCAPTGRAAQRMTESTGRESVTIHRLLDYRPYESEILCKDANNPIEADFIVVDEASMLDIELASLFLNAVKNGTLVLFIGDINQLPSVGAGDVLHDMIYSERISCVQLTEVYRQKGTSPIVANANRINEGNLELIENDEFIISHKETAEEMPQEIVNFVTSFYDFEHPFDTTVLCPTHKGDAGVANINKLLQNLINPKNGKEYRFGTRSYRTGDKIIMLQNNYSAGYFNGDLGIVTDILEHGIEVNIMGKLFEITNDMMSDVNLAYAMTIHKSQGSEFKNVIVSLPYQPTTMLKRNLTYTAVTRAKKNVVIVAEYGALSKSIQSTNTGTRKTDLIRRIRDAIDDGKVAARASA